MKKTLAIIWVAASILAVSSLAKGKEGDLCIITEMYIAGVPAQQITGELQVPRDWLEDGELIIEGQASKEVEKVEITLDNGKTWQPAQGTTSWYYSVQPLPGEKFRIAARAWCKGTPSHPYRRKFYKTVFIGKTSRDIIEGIFRKIELYYQGKNRLQVMKLFSRRFRSPLYSNYRELEVQIRNDFQWGSGMEYRFYIDQVLKSGNIYIVQTHWDLTYLGLLEPKHGYTEFHFDAGNQWKIVDIRGDKPFGIIEEPKPDLEVVESEIQGTSPDNMRFILTIPVHNNGRIAARRVVVKATCRNAYNNPGSTATTTVKTIPIMGINIVTLEVNGYDWLLESTTCTITVDPQNRISETNEDNNRVQKTFATSPYP